MDINTIDYEKLVNYIKRNPKKALNISILKFLKTHHDYTANEFDLISKIIDIVVNLDPKIKEISNIGWNVDIQISVESLNVYNKSKRNVKIDISYNGLPITGCL